VESAFGTHDLFNIVDAVETVNHFTTLSIYYNSLGIGRMPI
jgi:hypothetical protein